MQLINKHLTAKTQHFSSSLRNIMGWFRHKKGRRERSRKVALRAMGGGRGCWGGTMMIMVIINMKTMIILIMIVIVIMIMINVIILIIVMLIIIIIIIIIIIKKC